MRKRNHGEVPGCSNVLTVNSGVSGQLFDPSLPRQETTHDNFVGCGAKGCVVCTDMICSLHVTRGKLDVSAGVYRVQL